MKIALITDAWQPQMNGVVMTMVELVKELENSGYTIEVVHPGLFKTRPCPGYAGIDWAVSPKKILHQRLDAYQADVIHIATEGPLGWAARAYCRKRSMKYTRTFHTKFPEIFQVALRIPLSWGYALFRYFHKYSAGVMVPTEGVLHMLKNRKFLNLRSWTHGVDTELFAFHARSLNYLPLQSLTRPVSLFVWRVSHEKNIDAFLKLDLPGSKVVCGVGPLEATLKERYPDVRWLGLLDRQELAQVYAASDVFVFPSKSETFGLVMLEAMAASTPVAEYPVDGPLQVLGSPIATNLGGAMHENLLHATQQALLSSRQHARDRAMDFSWGHAAKLFESHLVSVEKKSPFLLTQNAHNKHKPVESS